MGKTALVLEGGGMRSTFSAGVLESFMARDTLFSYIIGVSAGACVAASYLSRQPGRNKKVNIDFVTHPDYLSFKNWIRRGQFFGMDLIFDEIPNRHVPFDYDRFYQNDGRFMIGATDINTGEPHYFDGLDQDEDLLKLLRASSSLPLMAPPVTYQDYELLDGGISDPIPVKKALEDGCDRAVVILTRNMDYKKSATKLKWLQRRLYKKTPKIGDTVLARHYQYNKTLDELKTLEKEGTVLVIRPEMPLKVGRMEKDPEKLTRLYEEGQTVAEKYADRIEAFIS